VGRRIVAGDGTAPMVAVAIADHVTLGRIIRRPSLGVGEAYVDGKLVLLRGTIHDLVELASRNSARRPGGPRQGA